MLPFELGSVESFEVDIAPPPTPSESRQLASSVASEDFVASVTFSSLRGRVDEMAVLAPNSESLFGKEICDLLVSLEAACPGYWLRLGRDSFGRCCHEGGKFSQKEGKK